MRRHPTQRLAALAAAFVGLLALTASTANAAGVSPAFYPAGAAHAQITGSGSSWSANAVNQWIADVTSSGLQVVFTSTGSATGRKDFTNRTTDFAVTDIGYQGVDKVTGEGDSNCTDPNTPATCRAFAYLPVVAGGTAFAYQIKVAGKLVRNLRLSGETLARIFTNQITNWNDPAITSDNNGRKLPSIPIIVVVHAEGSGSTAQFTRYLDKQYPTIWRPFLGQAGSTEYFPRKGQMIAQNGSDGVINFLTSGAANGAIGYDEYSYALAKNFPVAKIRNTAGYFTLPTQYNVAVALTQARICGVEVKPSSTNPDCSGNPAKPEQSPQYLLQNLDNVYTYSDNRNYALSSYSYIVIPTAPDDSRMTTAKRQTLVDYLYYSICQGQAEMGPIGYSPLPVNLVQASFNQTARLKTADAGVDLTKRNVANCKNPTFVAGNPKANQLAKIAPQPLPCDKSGAGPCNGNGNTGTGKGSNGGGSNNPGGGGTNNSGGGGTNNSGGGGTNSPGGGGTNNPGGGGTTGSSGVVNPDTGQVDNSGRNGTSADVIGTATEVAAYRSSDLKSSLAPVVAFEIVALLALPPAAYFLWLRRRRSAA